MAAKDAHGNLDLVAAKMALRDVPISARVVARAPAVVCKKPMHAVNQPSDTIRLSWACALEASVALATPMLRTVQMSADP
jgi:hypothetical protein